MEDQCQHDGGVATGCSSSYIEGTGEEWECTTLCILCGARLVGKNEWVEGTEEDKQEARWWRRYLQDPLDTPGVVPIPDTDFHVIDPGHG